MTICDKGFALKTCTTDENGHIIAVKIIPESITICPVYNVESDHEMHFATRELALEALWKQLNKITNEEEENEQISAN